MRVVAEVEVKGIIEDTPQVVWSKTQSAAGIDKIFFDRYYSGRDVAVAYVLGKVRKFAAPKSLSDYGVKAAPAIICLCSVIFYPIVLIGN